MKIPAIQGFLSLLLLVFFGGVESVHANLCGVNPGECVPIFTSPTGNRLVLNNCPHDNPTPGQPGMGCSWDLCYGSRNDGPMPVPANAVAYCDAMGASSNGINIGYYSHIYWDFNGDSTMDMEYRQIPPTPTPGGGGPLNVSFVFTPNSHNFGNVQSASLSAPLNVNIRNNGTSPVGACAVGIENPADFVLSGESGCTSFTAGGSCNVTLRARPGSNAVVNTTMTVSCGMPQAHNQKTTWEEFFAGFTRSVVDAVIPDAFACYPVGSGCNGQPGMAPCCCGHWNDMGLASHAACMCLTVVAPPSCLAGGSGGPMGGYAATSGSYVATGVGGPTPTPTTGGGPTPTATPTPTNAPPPPISPTPTSTPTPDPIATETPTPTPTETPTPTPIGGSTPGPGTCPAGCYDDGLNCVQYGGCLDPTAMNYIGKSSFGLSPAQLLAQRKYLNLDAGSPNAFRCYKDSSSTADKTAVPQIEGCTYKSAINYLPGSNKEPPKTSPDRCVFPKIKYKVLPCLAGAGGGSLADGELCVMNGSITGLQSCSACANGPSPYTPAVMCPGTKYVTMCGPSPMPGVTCGTIPPVYGCTPCSDL